MTRLTGLIGFPTEHSLSPHIHAYWAERYNIETQYKLFTTPPNRLRQTMLHMRKKNVVGVNITVPHKQAVLDYLDEIDPIAKTIGAVNTVINRDGTFIGTNTDAYGFITNLKAGLGDLTPYKKHALLLGAGGATRAAIVALQQENFTTITITNRTSETARQLADAFHLKIVPWEEKNAALQQASLLVNTTSLGMQHQPPLALDLTALPTHAAVHDIVYAPLETPLLAAAKARGNRVVDGFGMLLYQAQRAFEAWHGILPDVTPELRHYILNLTP